MSDTSEPLSLGPLGGVSANSDRTQYIVTSSVKHRFRGYDTTLPATGNQEGDVFFLIEA